MHGHLQKEHFPTLILHLSLKCIKYSLILTTLVLFESAASYRVEIGALRPV